MFRCCMDLTKPKTQVKRFGKRVITTIWRLVAELLATGILPTLSLESDYISRFSDFAQNRNFSADLVLIFIFIQLEGYLEPRNAIKLSRFSRGAPGIQFCPRGLDRLTQNIVKRVDLFSLTLCRPGSDHTQNPRYLFCRTGFVFT